MIVNFVGSFTTGYVGETSDESHLAREIEAMGHVVKKLPRDEWREHVLDMKSYPNIPNDLVADINIVAKWHGFDNGKYIQRLREESGAPILYWVWDYMQGEPWHMNMVHASDLYLSNDVKSGKYDGVANCYYFPFDVSDRNYDRIEGVEKIFDVTFFGSWINQGDRQEWLKSINKMQPVTVFTWNPKEWPEEFKDVRMPVYGDDFAYRVAQSKICLGFSVNAHTWGYWSNRVGKILTAGGFLLYQYAPGMELFLRDGVEYFSSVSEAVYKIGRYLEDDKKRNEIAQRGYEIGRTRFTSEHRIKDLMILIDRFIKEGNIVWYK